MAALGFLEEAGNAGLFTKDTPELVRPGKDAPLLLSIAQRKVPLSEEEQVTAAILDTAHRDLERAQRVARSAPSSTTFASLAQSHAVLGHATEALTAARTALDLGLVQGQRQGDGELRIADASSSRIAAEIMLRFGAAEDAFWALKKVHVPHSLLLTFAALASELGHYDEAIEALDSEHDALVESFRGFVLALKGDYQKAIHHLRNALRDQPNDADAAMNLAVSLWALGSRRKAVATALRATRTAPGRKDVSLLYLALVLEIGDLRRLDEEVKALIARNVVPDARFLIIQARAYIAKNESARAIPLLERAIGAANVENDVVLRVEVAANLAVLRFRLGRRNYDETMRVLNALLRDSPDHEAVALCLAQVASRSRDASALRRAVEAVESHTSPARRAYLHHQLAWLEGDNATAGTFAAEWFDLEPHNAVAAASAIVALGIGLERWQEAVKVAEFAMTEFSDDLTIVNNAAYALAMAGRASEAIRLLEPWADTNFVPRATLGLAHLANGDIDRGMRLYRQAADEAEKGHAAWRSLMTTYQALIVRQLGIHKSERPEVISALALSPYPLPTDWKDRPDFVRLYNLCVKLGYDWPPSL
jgi:tetratricopeptide (TPR) repeat protein